MQEKVRNWIDRHALLLPGDSILAACSGGPDSLALVHILLVLRSEYGINLAVAHVDHMFRGLESAQDAQFVADFCRQFGLPCYQAAINVPEFIVHSGRSPQDAARLLRYQFLRQVASDLGGAKIATGHHRDDQAETVLINLLRGAGSVGIGGMKPVNGDIIRPLLAVSRQEIENYCCTYSLTPRLDSSNLKTDYLRNRLRHELLPELEQKYNPSIKEALCRTAELVGAEGDFVRSTIMAIWSQVVKEFATKINIDKQRLANLHIAQQRELFRLVIEKKQGSLTGITFHHVEKLINLALFGQVGSVFELPGRLLARNGYHDVEIYLKQQQPIRRVELPETTIKVPGVTVVPELELIITAEISATEPQKRGSSTTAVFDCQALVLPLYVRLRRDGDRFQPLGLSGSKKLKDFFIDAKVPREARDRAPIICDNNGILWVGGYRQAERGKVTNSTQRFLQLTLDTRRNSHA